jgi:antitoxin VapB
MPELAINDAEAERLARELAALTGESVEEAVRIALQLRRDALSERDRLTDRIIEIGRTTAATLDLKGLNRDSYIDHSAFLYDDRGLPR